jgi:regulator of protease activity HflC (stomatin/prohibitin superfamily)
MITISILIAVVTMALVLVGSSVRVITQYERGVVFRFGRVRPETRGPGLALIAPIADRLQKVNMQIITQPVPAQDGITRDNVTVRVDAVLYYRVVDAVRVARRRAGLRLGHPAGRAGLAALDHRQERAG